MNKLSTGADSTLGEYLALTKLAFGEGAAVKFLEDKIAAAPNGDKEEVMADETQMLHLLTSIAFSGRNDDGL